VGKGEVRGKRKWGEVTGKRCNVERSSHLQDVVVGGVSAWGQEDEGVGGGLCVSGCAYAARASVYTWWWRWCFSLAFLGERVGHAT